MPVSINANEIDYTTVFNNPVVEKIDQYFIENPQKTNVIWSPKIKGKTRYSFLIPRYGHEIAKKNTDSSDLYYLSEKIDNGLKVHSNISKNIDIIISKNNSNIILSQSIVPGINAGLFLKKKDKESFGLILHKDVILSKNSLGNVGVEQAKDKYTVFNAKFAKLFNNENSEFYGNINHKFKSNILDIDLGHTWFEIANQIDITAGIQERGKKVDSYVYATYDYENLKFQIGLNQNNSNSNTNMYFNMKFENVLNKKKVRTNVMVTSRDSVFGPRRLSLKSYRKKNLDIQWKKNINYD